MEKCNDCQKDNGIFDMKNECCRERHYRMTLGVSRENAAGELIHIRRKNGAEEADRLSMIEPPPRKFSSPAKKPAVVVPPPKAKSTEQAAIDF